MGEGWGGGFCFHIVCPSIRFWFLSRGYVNKQCLLTFLAEGLYFSYFSMHSSENMCDLFLPEVQ